MNEFIDINDMPGVRAGRPSAGRWAEWDSIPPGKALEITSLIPDGTTAIQFATINSLYTTAVKHGLRARARGDRLFICKPEEVPA